MASASSTVVPRAARDRATRGGRHPAGSPQGSRRRGGAQAVGLSGARARDRVRLARRGARVPPELGGGARRPRLRDRRGRHQARRPRRARGHGHHLTPPALGAGLQVRAAQGDHARREARRTPVQLRRRQAATATAEDAQPRTAPTSPRQRATAEATCLGTDVARGSSRRIGWGGSRAPSIRRNG